MLTFSAFPPKNAPRKMASTLAVMRRQLEHSNRESEMCCVDAIFGGFYLWEELEASLHGRVCNADPEKEELDWAHRGGHTGGCRVGDIYGCSWTGETSEAC